MDSELVMILTLSSPTLPNSVLQCLLNARELCLSLAPQERQ